MPLLGTSLSEYRCAEIFVEDDSSWDRWDDMPVRLFFGAADVVSVSWTDFNDLLVAPFEVLPDWYGTDSARIRWTNDRIPGLTNCIGRTLTDVFLGRGDMSVSGEEMEVWTRLVLGFDDLWLEIFNALDENGYQQHSTMPDGDFRRCVWTDG